MLMMSKCAPLVGFEQGGGGPNIANLFATTLYTGNGTGQAIASGIDLAGLGGLAWIKQRSGSASGHMIYDTLRGGQKYLQSNTSGAQVDNGAWDLTGFTSSGVTLANAFSDPNSTNSSPQTYVLWSFARAARFFDVVTWTGNGSARTIAHNLAVAPGIVIVKRTNAVESWYVWHRIGTQLSSHALNLNDTLAYSNFGISMWGSDAESTPNMNASTFSIGNNNGAVNSTGDTYVAYLFAHDTAADGVVQCGSYTGNGSSTGPTVTLGWQPQWLLIKRTDSTGDWWIYDSVRSTSNPRILKLLANSSAAEDTSGEDVDFLSTGFQPKTTAAGINANGGTYVYVAVRAAS